MSDVHIVDKIIGKKITDGKVYYLIKWENYNTKDSTWEPLNNLTDIDDLIKIFCELPWK